MTGGQPYTGPAVDTYTNDELADALESMIGDVYGGAEDWLVEAAKRLRAINSDAYERAEARERAVDR